MAPRTHAVLSELVTVTEVDNVLVLEARRVSK
jgi:hypothetical protein